MPGFDQDSYAALSEANERDLENIFEVYEAVSNATIALFNGLPDNSFSRMGTGSSIHQRATVRALSYHMAGHKLHHIIFIKENYLQKKQLFFTPVEYLCLFVGDTLININ